MRNAGTYRLFKKYLAPVRCAAVAALMVFSFAEHAAAQYVLLSAREQNSLFNYEAAIPLFKRAFARRQTAEAARGVANAFYSQRRFDSAVSWYSKLIALPGHTPEDEFFYARTLMGTGRHAEARALLIRIDTSKLKGNAPLIANMIAGCDSVGYWMAHPVAGSVINVNGLNSAQSDWGAVPYRDEVVFSSDRPTGVRPKRPFFSTSNISTRRFGWTGESYLHLYAAKNYDSAGIAILDTAMINGLFHTAAASFTANGKELFFASTRLVKKRAKFIGKEPPYIINIEIFYTRWDTAKNRWQAPVKFPYNNILQNSFGDPYITPGGQTLYFTSDVGIDNFGGTDIYYSKRISDTAWSAPVNMGSEINTAGDERTPFFDSAGVFYFASNGHAGMGGLDIFRAVQDAGGRWCVANIGKPVNSPQDDFSPFFIKGLKGYFASNRHEGKGSDDIYRFVPAIIFRLEGEVLHVKTNQPVSGAEVRLTDVATSRPVKVITGDDGKFAFPLDSAATYALSAAKPGFTPSATEAVTTAGLTESAVIHKTLYLDDVAVVPPVPPAPPEPIAIEPIFYNFDKSYIRYDAKEPLNHIVELMKQNPAWAVHITSHTDSRGTAEYNMALSERRAQAAVNFLVEHGIAAERITAKGYGETRLVNRCSDGVPCTGAEHQLNRRSEFEFRTQ